MECSRILKLISAIFLVGCSSSKILSTSTENIALTKSEFLKSIEMSNVKGGDLILGPRVHIDEGDKKLVKVKSFKISKTELTQLQWTFVMKSNPSKFKTNKDCKNHSKLNGVELCPDLPVESLTKSELDTFLKKLHELSGKKYYLPSEYQWELAVKDIDLHNQKMEYDDSVDFSSVKNNPKRTISVKSKKPLGNDLFLTGGNVWEITSTEYNKFEYTGIKKKSDEGHLVIKGAGWNSKFDHVRRSYRGKWPVSLRSPDVGVRLAL